MCKTHSNLTFKTSSCCFTHLSEIYVQLLQIQISIANLITDYTDTNQNKIRQATFIVDPNTKFNRDPFTSFRGETFGQTDTSLLCILLTSVVIK
jgi:hypothetical protein